MKTTTTIILATTFVGGMLLTSCGNTAENQADKMNTKMDKVQDDLDAAAEADSRAAYESERNAALDRLRNFRTNIDKELTSVDERLATKDLKADKRAEQVALKAELEQQKVEVARVISSVESSTQGTWINVKDETRSASDKMDAWWERTKDNVDARTDSDRDRDGK